MKDQEQIKKIIDLVYCHTLSLYDEKELQQEISTLLKDKKQIFNKEYYLDSRNIIDFYFPDNKIGMEVKIKGSSIKIYRQCERYCSFDQIEHLILATNKSMGLPKTIKNKNIYVIKLGEAWL